MTTKTHPPRWNHDSESAYSSDAFNANKSRECTGEDAELMVAEIDNLKSSNQINNWAESYLLRVCKQGLTTDLWSETVDDMILASELGVSSEEDFRAFFYIDHFVEDLIEELIGVQLTESEQDSLKTYMFSIRNEVGYTDLLSFRVAILKWMKNNGKTVKQALWGSTSRNRGVSTYYLKKYNIERWKTLVELVRKSIAYGIPKKVALREAADQLEGIEKYDFLSWYNFKFGNERVLYNLNKKIKEKSKGNLSMTKPTTKLAGIYEDQMAYYIPKFNDHIKQYEDTTSTPEVSLPSYNEQKVQDFNTARSKMVSRTFAIDKLLEKYVDILKEEQVEEIEDALNQLRKKVRKLKMASIVNDSFHKTANILEKNNFDRGAEVLRLIANNDVIEKTAITKAHSKDLEDMLQKLYDISDSLKRRDLVRLLAEIDLRLYELNIAGFFPELTDAQSKLIDAYAYASNKVQDVIPKLRSGITQGGGVSFDLSEEDLLETETLPVDQVKPEGQDLADEVSKLVHEIEKPVSE